MVFGEVLAFAAVLVAATISTSAAAGQYNTQQQQYGTKSAYGNSYNSYQQPQQPQSYYPKEQGYGKSYGYEEKYQEHPAKYQFYWAVKDDPSYNNYYHNEARDGDTTYGEYGVLLPDGRYQTVKYTVDKWGYKADVQYQGEAKYDKPKASYGGSDYGHQQKSYGTSYQQQPQQAYGYQPQPPQQSSYGYKQPAAY